MSVKSAGRAIAGWLGARPPTAMKDGFSEEADHEKAALQLIAMARQLMDI
jgi:hypothetical protein